jgi:hypothetical protein
LVDKARRVLPKMVGTIAFFYAELGRQLAELSLSAPVHAYVMHARVPAAYLARLAQRAATVAERTHLLALRQTLLDQVDPTCWLALPPDTRQRIERVVLMGVDLFARSTSCVEGRNGYLALWHHHLHRLSAARLTSLTVIHNFWIRRADGTTAAERFFDAQHRDLFEWLLDHRDLPARPAATPDRAIAA